MCLSGYIFDSPTAILPYLEEPRIGPTSLLARSLARRLKCHVVAGYPEVLPKTTESSSAVESGPSTPTRSGTPRRVLEESRVSSMDAGPTEMKVLEGEGEGVGYNSAIVVGPEGEVLGNYRKTFRFETDKCWAREGK